MSKFQHCFTLIGFKEHWKPNCYILFLQKGFSPLKFQVITSLSLLRSSMVLLNFFTAADNQFDEFNEINIDNFVQFHSNLNQDLSPSPSFKFHMLCCECCWRKLFLEIWWGNGYLWVCVCVCVCVCVKKTKKKWLQTKM